MTTQDLPRSIRRLASEDGARLARLVAAYDDAQTVLRCCEELVARLAPDGSEPDGSEPDGSEPDGSEPDGVDVEALWTFAVLAYGRLFATGRTGAPLTEDDVVTAAEGRGDPEQVRRTHRLLLHLRDRHADPAADPRETYTAGVALDPDGAVNAVAVTSVRAPRLDVAAVRRAGAIAYPLVAVLDQRIDPLQARILAAMRGASRADLEALDRVEVR
ncbi:hypothetical protein SAMN05443575_2087 [Jatrophihabitans endophyticus]|uniref:Uncharacterized protein n=1 Tax=Jatrophihabitans endophyticus TaxID=1206085 RepID=A0A1M5K8Y0_9ACTN|nr:hypothetical protein [Jatrophihabitans endophyticus]SHG49286.1 hypothetical protein SAMN05443575_2087 [Jatrophihabitans endophyticus]